MRFIGIRASNLHAGALAFLLPLLPAPALSSCSQEEPACVSRDQFSGQLEEQLPPSPEQLEEQKLQFETLKKLLEALR